MKPSPMNKVISFKIDAEMETMLDIIKKYYNEKLYMDIWKKSDLIRTIILREYFRAIGKLNE